MIRCLLFAIIFTFSAWAEDKPETRLALPDFLRGVWLVSLSSGDTGATTETHDPAVAVLKATAGSLRIDDGTDRVMRVSHVVHTKLADIPTLLVYFDNDTVSYVIQDVNPGVFKCEVYDRDKDDKLFEKIRFVFTVDP